MRQSFARVEIASSPRLPMSPPPILPSTPPPIHHLTRLLSLPFIPPPSSTSASLETSLPLFFVLPSASCAFAYTTKPLPPVQGLLLVYTLLTHKSTTVQRLVDLVAKCPPFPSRSPQSRHRLSLPSFDPIAFSAERSCIESWNPPPRHKQPWTLPTSSSSRLREDRPTLLSAIALNPHLLPSPTAPSPPSRQIEIAPRSPLTNHSQPPSPTSHTTW